MTIIGPLVRSLVVVVNIAVCLLCVSLRGQVDAGLLLAGFLI